MKRITALLGLVLAASIIYAQDTHLMKLQELETDDTTKVAVQDTTLQSKSIEGTLKSASKDTTKVRLGKREIVIIEKDGKTSIEIPESSDKYSFDSNKDKGFTYKKKSRFKGHWAGFEWGFNGYLDQSYSNVMQGDLKYLELKQPRSWNFNLNFMQYSIGFGSDKIGLVTGLGFEFNNYHFRNETTLKVENGITVEDNSYALDPSKNLVESKLYTNHLTVPLLLEFQIPTSHRHRIFLSTGVVGGVRIASSTKLEYEGTTKGKEKKKDDFNLAAFRYGYTARIGYRGLSLFATFYPIQLFEENKGPELYPFAIGLRLLNFGGS